MLAVCNDLQQAVLQADTQTFATVDEQCYSLCGVKRLYRLSETYIQNCAIRMMQTFVIVIISTFCIKLVAMPLLDCVRQFGKQISESNSNVSDLRIERASRREYEDILLSWGNREKYSTTLWWGYDGLRLNEDGTSEWISRMPEPEVFPLYDPHSIPTTTLNDTKLSFIIGPVAHDVTGARILYEYGRDV